MAERIIDTSRMTDPRGLRDGEFGDTDTTREKQSQPQKKLTFYEQFRQNCYDRGMDEEGFKIEWSAYMAVFGD